MSGLAPSLTCATSRELPASTHSGTETLPSASSAASMLSVTAASDDAANITVSVLSDEHAGSTQTNTISGMTFCAFIFCNFCRVRGIRLVRL